MNGNGMKLVFGMNSFFFHFNSKVRVPEKFVLGRFYDSFGHPRQHHI